VHRRRGCPINWIAINGLQSVGSPYSSEAPCALTKHQTATTAVLFLFSVYWDCKIQLFCFKVSQKGDSTYCSDFAAWMPSPLFANLVLQVWCCNNIHKRNKAVYCERAVLWRSLSNNVDKEPWSQIGLCPRQHVPCYLFSKNAVLTHPFTCHIRKSKSRMRGFIKHFTIRTHNWYPTRLGQGTQILSFACAN
jgi:hypothetical protein